MERRQMLSTVTVGDPVFGMPNMTGPGTVNINGGGTIEWRADGTVQVTGTPGDDRISLSRGNAFSPDADAKLYQLTVDGWTVTLSSNASSPITRFDVDAGDGNDHVWALGPAPISYEDRAVLFDTQVPGTNVVVLPYGNRPAFDTPLSLSGGAGDDTLEGGWGEDTLDGGTGADRLVDIHGHNHFVTDPGVEPSGGDAGRWYEIGGGGAYVGLSTDGTLDVRGSDADDVITLDWDLSHPQLNVSPISVTVNGVQAPSDLVGIQSNILRVHVDAAGGDDAITVTGNVPYPATLLGGAGDDMLNGDAAADELHLNATVTGNPGRPVDRLLGASAFVVTLPDGASIAWDPAGVLSVHGTAGDDSIAVDQVVDGLWGDQPQLVLHINNDEWTFRPADANVAVSRIEIDAGDGNDRVQNSFYLSPDVGYMQVRSVDFYMPIKTFPTVTPPTIPLLVHGGAGNDTLWGAAGSDTLYGDAGDDELQGGSGPAADVLYGGDGDDDLTSPGAANTLYGGAGNDHLRRVYRTGALLVAGDPGDDPLPAGAGDWYELGDGAIAGVQADGTLYVRGTAGDDVITISRPDGLFFEGAPIDVTANGVTRSFEPFPLGLKADRIQVDAGDGNDRVTVGPRLNIPVSVDGGAGDDALDVAAPNYTTITLTGGDGADTLNGNAGTDELVFVGPIQPPIWTGPVIPPLEPPGFWPPLEPWPPIIVLNPLPPFEIHPIDPAPSPSAPPDQQSGPSLPVVRSLVIDGATGPVVTKAGTRVALAGGASIQWRTDGVFVVRGTSGDDVIRVGRSGKGKNATLLVKVNNVTRSFRVGAATIRRVDIDAGDGDDAVLLGGSDVDGSVFASPLDVAANIAGGRGNDTLVGGSKADTIHGGAGQDSISGGAGNDLLYGDAGLDTLTGGAGRDRAVGAKGSDLMSEIEAAT